MSEISDEELLDTEGVVRGEDGKLRFRIIEVDMFGWPDSDE